MPASGGHSGPPWAALTWLGFIELSTSVALSAEIPAVLPANTGPLFTRMRLPSGEVSASALGRMVDSNRLEEAGFELADGGAATIAFACTLGSLLRGPGFDGMLVARMERAAGVRATTTATALLTALSVLGARKLAVVTPYPSHLDQLEKRFLEDSGYEVVALRGMGISFDTHIAAVPYAHTRALVRRTLAEADDADTVFLSCTNLPTLALLASLEQECGRPVISSNAVTLWHSLHLAGITSRTPGWGSLLEFGQRAF
ncbi:maleate cis-trans isomerase family protein [Streptomyces sp. NPDC002644]